MANIIDTLNVAIEIGDWEKVQEVVRMLGGEPNESKHDRNPTHIHIGEETYEAIEPERNDEPVEEEASQETPFMTTIRNADEVTGSDPNKQYAKRQPMNAPKRKTYVGQSAEGWEDDLTEDTVDPQTGKSLLVSENPTAGAPKQRFGGQQQRVAQLVHVQCCSCKNWFDVSPALSYGYRDDSQAKESEQQNTWRCNDCGTSRGRSRQNREERQALNR